MAHKYTNRNEKKFRERFETRDTSLHTYTHSIMYQIIFRFPSKRYKHNVFYYNIIYLMLLQTEVLVLLFSFFVTYGVFGIVYTFRIIKRGRKNSNFNSNTRRQSCDRLYTNVRDRIQFQTF